MHGNLEPEENVFEENHVHDLYEDMSRLNALYEELMWDHDEVLDFRSDALDIKVFTRKCKESLINCKYVDTNKSLIPELKKEILKKATFYKRQDSEKDEKKKN